VKKIFGIMSFTVLLIAGSAWAAIAPDPDTAGPINCTDAVPLVFHYTPESGVNNLRGYSIRVTATSEVSFGAEDILVSELDEDDTWIEVIENGSNDFTIDFAILGPTSGLAGELDFFTITFHGAGDGDAAITMSDVVLRDVTNQNIAIGTLDIGSIAVDCTAPNPPVLAAEDPFTAGTNNTISWSDESASGAFLYYAQRATNPGFTGAVSNAAVSGTSDVFTGLTDGLTYFYRVRTADAVDNYSPWSNVVSSTQDNSPPDSSVDALPTYSNQSTINVPYTAVDAGVGVASVDLYVRFDGGAFQSYGTFFASPISFEATADGTYGFYTIAIDELGNQEAAPVTPPDAETTIDTANPTGTFVINDDDTTTPSVSVNLDSDIADDNPPLEMRFSNDNTNWPDGWVAYAVDQAWTLASGADGARTVYAEYKDAAGNILQLIDAISLDSTGPDPVTDLTATVGHEKVTVTWVDPASADAVNIEIYRGLWHDDAGASIYPEYDDHDEQAEPTRPASRTAAVDSDEWSLVTTVGAGVQTFTDNITDRGVYYYELFAVDSFNNYSNPAVVNDRATNYWLGDLEPASYDGDVEVADLAVLGATYGNDPDDVGIYNNEADVGPTDDTTATGVPTTDSFIDFEDLMIFSLNYGVATPAPTGHPASDNQLASFMWQRVDEQTWTLNLQQSCTSLKGVRIEANLPSDSVVSLVKGELLDAQNSPVFLKNIDNHGLDVGLAVMGTDTGISGAGELFTVTLAPGTDMTALELTTRDVVNAEIVFDLEVLDGVSHTPQPTAFRLVQNYPNPFNPRTKIAYELPSSEAVRLSVYSLNGRRIAVLVDEVQGAGHHFAYWNGMDNHGQPVASGTYFYRINAGSFSQTRSMVLMK